MKAAEAALARLDGVVLRHGVSAKELTTFGVGAATTLLAELNSIEACRSVCRSLEELAQPWKMLGGGSNVVLPDAALDYPLLRLGRGLQGAALEDGGRLLPVEGAVNLLNQSDEEPRLYVGAATSLMSLSRLLTSKGLSGFEFASGIPATVGGAVAMNAGAHGGCIADALVSVHVAEAAGESFIDASELSMGYRTCELPAGTIVVGASFRLRRRGVEDCRKQRRENLMYRKRTQPLHLPSAGSVFRNPSQASAGELLEDCGFKGRRCGGIEFSQMHANWLVRLSAEAKSSEVAQLLEAAMQEVRSRKSIDLQPEIRLW